MERDPENGMLIGPDGGHYDTEQEAHHYGTLGLCGCGDPEGVYSFLRDILKLADRRGKGEWIILSNEVEKLVQSNPSIAAEALLHFLDDRGVIEHGSSVGGSWLTESGERIVDLPPMVETEDA